MSFSSSSSFWTNIDDPQFGVVDSVAPMPACLVLTTNSGTPSEPYISNSSTTPAPTASASSAREFALKKRGRTLTTSTATGEQAVKLRRLNKRRRLPLIASATKIVTAKYPSEIKKALDSCLLHAGLDCDVHNHIRSAVRRPALLHMVSYWYVAWHLVRCYVAIWPLLFLPRCEALLHQLVSAQQIVMRQFPQIMHEPSIERRSREQYCFSTDAASSKQNNISAAAATSSSGSTITSEQQRSATSTCLPSFKTASVSGDSPTTVTDFSSLSATTSERARNLFESSCSKMRVLFHIDPAVRNYVMNDAAGEFSSDAKGKLSVQQIAYRQTMFECFAMFILAVVERSSDIYLKRSNLNGYVVELSRVQAQFKHSVADGQSGLEFEPQDIAIGSRFDPTTKSFSTRLDRTISQNDVRVAHSHICNIFEALDQKNNK